MKYPLKEKIGNSNLMVGRQDEFDFINAWIDNIPQELSKSKVMLARRKSGKTAFVQRLFNQLWSQPERGVIPFYFSMPESKIWYPEFAIDYYCAFASQYISFLERDESLVRDTLSLEEIRDYGLANSIKLLVKDAEFMLRESKVGGSHGLMWNLACDAPHRYASVYNQRFLVILDEFQYIGSFVYPTPDYQTAPIETLPGSYHSLSESKVAPMLVTGSYISWIADICSKYLEAGRLSYWEVSPYLTPEEGLEAVYKYATAYQQPITNETALLINRLCMSDPFFISCVIQSSYRGKNLSSEEGVINTVNYEISDYTSEMSKTWGEYIAQAVNRINDVYGKHILLHLSKYNEREWTPQELKDALPLPLPVKEIHYKLDLMVTADVIKRGNSDIRYQGLQDGTLYLILRHRFEEEITTFAPDLRDDFSKEVEVLKKDKKRLQGMLNNLVGKFAEYQLANEFRSRKRFALSDFFEGVQDTTRLNIEDARLGLIIQRDDGKKMEIDVRALSACGRVVLVEVKKTQEKIGHSEVEDFSEKLTVYAKQFPNQIILPAFFSLGGFTEKARQLCQERGIGMAEKIAWE